MCASGFSSEKPRHNILFYQNILYRNCIFHYIFHHFPAYLTIFCSHFTIKCLGSGQKPETWNTHIFCSGLREISPYSHQRSKLSNTIVSMLIVAIYGGIGLYLRNRPACIASTAVCSHRLLEIGTHIQIISSFLLKAQKILLLSLLLLWGLGTNWWVIVVRTCHR